LPKGTILLTTRATIGEVAIATQECTTNQGFQSLIVNKEAKNIFISNWIKQNKKEFIVRANGSTFSEISKSEVESIPIFIPSIQEQEKISSFLSLIDDRIATQNKIIKELNVLKTTITKRIFSGQLRFKNASGDNYVDWKTKKLGDVTTLINKRNKNNEKLPVYSINNKLGFVPQSEQFEGVD